MKSLKLLKLKLSIHDWNTSVQTHSKRIPYKFLSLTLMILLILYLSNSFIKNEKSSSQIIVNKLITTTADPPLVENGKDKILEFYSNIKESRQFSKNNEDGVTTYLIDFFKVERGVYFEERAACLILMSFETRKTWQWRT